MYQKSEKTDALLLAHSVIEYFRDEADGKFMYRDDQDFLVRLAYKVMQKEEMREWNL